MMNKVMLIGNLGNDPVAKILPNGNNVTNISIATNRKWKDANNVKHTETEWHAVSLYGKLGEIANTYLKKGSTVYVEGRIKSSTGTDGKRYVDIIAEEMKMLDKTGNSNPSSVPVPSSSSYATYDDFDDDIPF